MMSVRRRITVLKRLKEVAKIKGIIANLLYLSFLVRRKNPKVVIIRNRAFEEIVVNRLIKMGEDINNNVKKKRNFSSTFNLLKMF